MKKLLLILFLVIFSFSAIGKNKYQTEVPYEVPIGQSILCEQEENVGFSWEDKKYVLSRYKKKKIIFKKINPNAKDILGKLYTLELKKNILKIMILFQNYIQFYTDVIRINIWVVKSSLTFAKRNMTKKSLKV